MKEIIAIVRPNKIARTRDILAELGFPGMNATKVLGRGKQRGIGGEVGFEVGVEPAQSGMVMKYVPKRLISIVVPDNDVPLVAGVIMRANRTGEHGDGRIYVCPIDEAVRIRTGETGEEVLI
jgi:nitrogen regulatory protein PII 2